MKANLDWVHTEVDRPHYLRTTFKRGADPKELACVRVHTVGVAMLCSLCKGRQTSGTEVLREVIRWCQANDITKLCLQDASRITVSEDPQSKIDFKLWRVLTTGRSWYEEHGAKALAPNKLLTETTEYDVPVKIFSRHYDKAKEALFAMTLEDLSKVGEELAEIAEFASFVETIGKICVGDLSRRLGEYFEELLKTDVAQFLHEFTFLFAERSHLGVMEVAEKVFDHSEVALWVAADRLFRSRSMFVGPECGITPIERIGRVALQRLRTEKGVFAVSWSAADGVAERIGQWINHPPAQFPATCKWLATVEVIKQCEFFAFDFKPA